MFDPDQSWRLVRTDLDPNCLHSDGRDHAFCGLSMTHKKETMLMLVNSLPTILVSSADNLCK